MPATSATLRIEHFERPNEIGTKPEQSELAIVSAEIERHFKEQNHAEVVVYRDEWDAISEYVDGRFAEFYISLSSEPRDRFGGRLDEVERGGMTIKLHIGDYETDARQARPSAETHQFQNAPDTDPVGDAIDRIQSLRRGRIENVAGGVSWLFSHASPAKQLRSVCETTGGELRYNPDQTIDYVGRIGQDKLEVIGPSNQTVTSEFSLEEHVQDTPTHLLFLGAGEGDAQLAAALESRDFGDEYPREIWTARSNKDIGDADRLVTTAEQAMAEFEQSPDYVEVEADIPGTKAQVELGDTFPVLYEQESIDTRLRVVDLSEYIDEQGIHYKATLSNRRFARDEDPDRQTRQDVQRYNQAFEGNTVPESSTGGRQPVNPANNYQMSVLYPEDVVRELNATVRIEGLPYRAYSSGAEAGGGVEQALVSASNDDFEALAFSWSFPTWTGGMDGTWSTINSFTFPSDANTSLLIWEIIATIQGGDNPDRTEPMFLRLYNADKNSYYPSEDGSRTLIREGIYPFGSVLLMDPTNVAGETHEIQVYNPLASGGTTDIAIRPQPWGIGQHTHDVQVDLPNHEHDPDPGIIEFDRYPSNCDVIVNGNSVGTALGDGDGSFTEEVDIGDMLTDGFNDIEVTSDTLGHVNATVGFDVFRQITSKNN